MCGVACVCVCGTWVVHAMCVWCICREPCVMYVCGVCVIVG